MYGDAKMNPAKIKLYRNKNSNFVRVHNIGNNHEYIHIIDKNGLLKLGIFRYKVPNMDTSIGSRYFRRGDRKEDRQYHLYRFNKSGNIEYEDQRGEEDKGWRLQTKYEYIPETFLRKKIK